MKPFTLHTHTHTPQTFTHSAQSLEGLACWAAVPNFFITCASLEGGSIQIFYSFVSQAVCFPIIELWVFFIYYGY